VRKRGREREERRLARGSKRSERGREDTRTRKRERKNKSMAGRALARGTLDAISETFSRRCTSHLDRDVSLSQEPLWKGLLGEAVRARPGDGQVSGSMATLLATNGQQASCFPCETVQCPFVFHCFPRESTSGAAVLLRGHQSNPHEVARDVVSAATITAWGNSMGTEPCNYSSL